MAATLVWCGWEPGVIIVTRSVRSVDCIRAGARGIEAINVYWLWRGHCCSDIILP